MDRRDHPRSRGVYSIISGPLNLGGGSSPLARGLLRRRRRRLELRGIIPARAGFTVAMSPLVRSCRDHPRSRGVYVGHRKRARSQRGSSPLARGLLPFVSATQKSKGIIPARAGFTSDPSPPADEAQDHPRSRGVYTASFVAWSAFDGSSPLARGLPDDYGLLIQSNRIIPARAGFTMSHFTECPGPAGSSPLARGLQAAIHRLRDIVRIIPARAGFTEPRSTCRPAHPDHPRSRGVYQLKVGGTALPAGSSPLARGLLPNS